MRSRWLTVESKHSQQAIADSVCLPKRVPIGIMLGLLLAGCVGPRVYCHRRNKNACTRQHRTKTTQILKPSCYRREQRFAFTGTSLVDDSLRAESVCRWHGLCCHLVVRTEKSPEREARLSAMSS